MTNSRYQIIEGDLGPMISDSRLTVFDVLEAEESGLNLYEICHVYNLTPLQVETALAYISEHREQLIPILRDIQAKAAEREAYYRARQMEIFREIEQSPPSPKRQVLNELMAKNRAERQKTSTNGNHS